MINGKEVSNKDGVQIEKDVNNNRYCLIIPKVNPSIHAGTVTIKASNSIGSAQHDILLNVYGTNKLYLEYFYKSHSTFISYFFLIQMHQNSQQN